MVHRLLEFVLRIGTPRSHAEKMVRRRQDRQGRAHCFPDLGEQSEFLLLQRLHLGFLVDSLLLGLHLRHLCGALFFACVRSILSKKNSAHFT